MLPLDDIIAAIASPPGGAARGIVRVSGPAAVECAARLLEDCGPAGEARLFGSEGVAPSKPRVVAGLLRPAEFHSPIPCDVYCWLRRGYTGQPVVEIHTIGSPPLLQAVLRSLCAAGARLAGPGEFTLRAFLSERIDLTQAEAVLGVIDADDGPTLDAALTQLAGGLARPLHRLRDDLLDLLAQVEAGLDFADEDLPFIAREELDRRLADAEDRLAALQRQMTSRAAPVDMAQAVLVGRPNTGKSSLFNTLAGGPSALVSHRSGTTRDYLTAELDFDGVKCRLIDTAGLRDEPQETSSTEDAVGRAAQLAAEAQRRTAQIEVLCLDSTRPLDDWERRELDEAVGADRRTVVLTKCDVPLGDCPNFRVGENGTVPFNRASDRRRRGHRNQQPHGPGHRGIAECVAAEALVAAEGRGDVVASTAARCRESLRLALRCLSQARSAAASQEELTAAEIRAALEELGKVVGAVYTDDILDRIFSRFCIGK